MKLSGLTVSSHVRSISLLMVSLLLSVKSFILWLLGNLNWLSVNYQVDIFSIIVIAFGLAMDSFAVSISSGVTIKQVRIRDAAKIALFFGLFQVGMPVLGWLFGTGLADLVSEVDHWIAFGLLSLVGGRMIYESVKKEKSENEKEIDPLSTHVLLVLSVATSIDAFAVGVSFAFLGVFILNPIIVIGTVTFLLCFLGVFAGNKFGQIFKNKLKIVGGIILIGIGLKILIQDLFFTPF
ncbi:MAG: manganese efflux pump MntP family protein [Candidatus Jordarchaeaceae archaeon]